MDSLWLETAFSPSPKSFFDSFQLKDKKSDSEKIFVVSLEHAFCCSTSKRILDHRVAPVLHRDVALPNCSGMKWNSLAALALGEDSPGRVLSKEEAGRNQSQSELK